MTSEYAALCQQLVPDTVREPEAHLGSLLHRTSIPDAELAENAGLFIPPRTLKRMLFLDELYQKILGVHGIVIQFGVRWGRDIATFDSLRTIYEPFNISRRIIGFDTFNGFSSIHPEDGNEAIMISGALNVTDEYESELNEVVACRRKLDPLPQIDRCQLIKGDASIELESFLAQHPETVVALAYFDMDIYTPTKRCLELLAPYITKGTVIAFDELNSPIAPGETVALREVYGLSRYAIQRSPLYSGQGAFVVVD